MYCHHAQNRTLSNSCTLYIARLGSEKSIHLYLATGVTFHKTLNFIVTQYYSLLVYDVVLTGNLNQRVGGDCWESKNS